VIGQQLPLEVEGLTIATMRVPNLIRRLSKLALDLVTLGVRRTKMMISTNLKRQKEGMNLRSPNGLPMHGVSRVQNNRTPKNNLQMTNKKLRVTINSEISMIRALRNQLKMEIMIGYNSLR
jgi:hypothetical protein